MSLDRLPTTSVNIALLGNYPHDGNESMIRYAEMLQKLLVESGHHAEIIRPEPLVGRLKPSGHGLGKWLGYIDKYLLFPLVLRRYVRRQQDPLLVHICDHSNAVYTQWLKDVPHLVTCHDIMAIQVARGLIPGYQTGWTGRLLQRWILSGLRNAAYVICDTQKTRQDFLALAPELESRSQTIELPLNYPYGPMSRDEALALLSASSLGADLDPGVDQFLFHVGGNQWYKNREGVIKIYAQLCATAPDLVRRKSLKLVMAGKTPSDAILSSVKQAGLVGKVIFLTSVSNQQLCALYSLAEVLVYPSLKEGFGWPIIEAHACGCPVVTSNRPPMNHLAGPTSLLANPEDLPEFTARILQILSDTPEARQKRKKEALLNSVRFDPRAFLSQMIAQYDSGFKQSKFNVAK